ncbi:hypothetical protein, partial [Staphylococcus pseudintermedius]|uniref:hypothetical protein n=1 Tax=Staphylococcus pseudintermedius TaxID=283734 RepID=UPI001E2D7712
RWLVEGSAPRNAMGSSAHYILSHPKSLSDFSLSFDWWNHSGLQELSETPEGSRWLGKSNLASTKFFTSIKPNLVEEPPPRKAMESSANRKVGSIFQIKLSIKG